MPILFNRPNSNLDAPGLDTPSFEVAQVINTMEIRIQKNAWPTDALMTASLEYSIDGEQTWLPGGSVTDDGTRTRDAYIRNEFNPPLASGSRWRAHVTVNQRLRTGVTVTVT